MRVRGNNREEVDEKVGQLVANNTHWPVGSPYYEIDQVTGNEIWFYNVVEFNAHWRITNSPCPVSKGTIN